MGFRGSGSRGSGLGIRFRALASYWVLGVRRVATADARAKLHAKLRQNPCILGGLGCRV